MSLDRFIYPIDFTAKIATNLASKEEYSIGVGKYRTIVPNKGALYADSIILKEKVGNKELIRGTDYECLYTYTDLIRQASGKEVVGAIVVFNQSAKSDLVLTYQFVGGPYSSSALAISQAIEALSLDDRDVLYENLINKPDYFIPAPHVHDIGDVFGFEYIINMLASIREAVLIGDNAVNNAIKASIEALELLLTNKLNAHLADMANPHGTTAHQTGTYNYQEIDDELQRIAVEFATVAPQFAALIQQIQVINNELGAINGVLESQARTLNSYQNAINGLDLTLTAITQRMVQAEADIDELEDQNLARKNEIANINASILIINTTLGQHGQRLNDIEAELLTVASNINNNASAITSLEQYADLLAESITDLEARTSSLESVNTSQSQTLQSHGGSINNLDTGMAAVLQRLSQLEAGSSHYRTGSSSVTGLIAGKKYCVSVYGITANRGTGGARLGPVYIANSGGTTLAQTSAANINWMDGNTPQTAIFVVTAPSDGVVNGYTDGGRAMNMVAFRID